MWLTLATLCFYNKHKRKYRTHMLEGGTKKKENWYWIDVLTIYWIHDHWIPIRPFTKRKKIVKSHVFDFFSQYIDNIMLYHSLLWELNSIGSNYSSLKMAQCQWGYIQSKVKRPSWDFESIVLILCVNIKY